MLVQQLSEEGDPASTTYPHPSPSDVGRAAAGIDPEQVVLDPGLDLGRGGSVPFAIGPAIDAEAATVLSASRPGR